MICGKFPKFRLSEVSTSPYETLVMTAQQPICLLEAELVILLILLPDFITLLLGGAHFICLCPQGG